MAKQDNPPRVKVLRDLVHSKKEGVVVGHAVGSDEIKRPLAELQAEYDTLRKELHADGHAKSANALEALLVNRKEEKRGAVLGLIKDLTYEEIIERRAKAREAQLAAKLEYERLSAAKHFIEAGQRLEAALAAATPEEREAYEAMKQSA
jgi:hypothetical protein